MVDKDDIIRMALKAGASQAVSLRNPDRPAHSFSMKHLECFAELVAAHEREECAKIAEEWSVGIDDPRYQCDCATAIRARK